MARSRVPRESQLILGGRSWYVAPRPRAEGKRPLADAVPLPSAQLDHNQHDMARARSELVCCASPAEGFSPSARGRGATCQLPLPTPSWLPREKQAHTRWLYCLRGDGAARKLTARARCSELIVVWDRPNGRTLRRWEACLLRRAAVWCDVPAAASNAKSATARVRLLHTRWL